MQSEIDNLFDSLKASLEVPLPPPWSDGRPLMIYGGGIIGTRTCEVLGRRGIVPVCFLDQKANGDPKMSRCGISAYAPDDTRITENQRREAHVIIGMLNHYTEIPLVIDNLSKLGYEKVSGFLEVHDHIADDFGDSYWLTKRASYLPFREKIAQAYALLSDEKSREQFKATLRMRFLKQDDALNPCKDQEYFPESLSLLKEPVRFVDCGAYRGDTLEQLLATESRIEAIAAFEPDPVNYRRLADFVRSEGRFPKDTYLFPCGLASSARQVRFAPGEGVASRVSEDGSVVIQCVALDDALPDFMPTMIKMDIEGSEIEALAGARNLIAENRPCLAICLYHKPSHLWEIPLLVRDIVGGTGKYYFRAHAGNGFEAVLYWKP